MEYLHTMVRVATLEESLDFYCTKLGLTDADVASVEQVADVLDEHFALLQRPIIIRDGRAIIGRPKDRVAPFLS